MISEFVLVYNFLVTEKFKLFLIFYIDEFIKNMIKGYKEINDTKAKENF